MNSIWRILTLFVFFTAALEAGEPKRMTNSDVVSMVKAELPESVVVLAIQKSAAGFDITPQALIALKNDGVGAKIIEAIISQQSQSQMPVAKEDKNPPPSEADLRKLFEGMVKEQSSGVITIAALKKVNGQVSSKNGVPIYSMSFDLAVVFSQSCIWRNVTFDSRLTFVVVPQHTGTGTAAILHAGTNPGLHVSGGSAFRVLGDAKFEKMEDGWRPIEIIRNDYRRVDPREIKQDGERSPTVEKSPTQTPPVPNFSAKDLVTLLATPITTPAQPGEATTLENGKATFARPAEYIGEHKGGGSEMHLYLKAAGKTGDSILVAAKPTALLNRNPSLESVVAGWRADDRKNNPNAKITEGVPSRLLGEAAQCYAMTFLRDGIVRHEICTVIVAKKHVVSVYLRASPETLAERLSDYQRVCESLVLNVK